MKNMIFGFFMVASISLAGTNSFAASGSNVSCTCVDQQGSTVGIITFFVPASETHGFPSLMGEGQRRCQLKFGVEASVDFCE